MEKKLATLILDISEKQFKKYMKQNCMLLKIKKKNQGIVIYL